jgi:hypothetical protein
LKDRAFGVSGSQMRSHERAFVKTVLERRSSLWLKTGVQLVIGGARLQCAQYCSAVDELVRKPLRSSANVA